MSRADAAPAGPGFSPEAFIAAREPRWTALEDLLDHLDAGGALDRGRIQTLLRLYRLACSDLNQARSFTSDPDLLGRLNRLVGRAYRQVYQAAPGGRRRGWLRAFLGREAPAAFWTERAWVRAAALAMLAGAVVGFLAVAADPERGAALIPEQFFTGSPAERVAEIESNPERIDSFRDAAAFSSMLYTHNIQVACLCFSLGALTIVGGWLILFTNGLTLGAVAAMYLRDGVGLFFLAWVGPHGALELPAILFAGAAGLRLGRAFHLPGDRGRAAALREAMPVAWRMLATAMLVLVAAGLVEGSFSQFSGKTVPYGLKIGVAAVLFAGLWRWLFRPQAPLEAAPAATGGRPGVAP